MRGLAPDGMYYPVDIILVIYGFFIVKTTGYIDHAWAVGCSLMNGSAGFVSPGAAPMLARLVFTEAVLGGSAAKTGLNMAEVQG